MSTDSKKITIFDMIKTLQGMFNSEPDVEEYDEKVLSGELKEKLLELKKTREAKVEQGINTSSKPSNKGGFAKKMDPKIEQSMREQHNEVAKNIKPSDKSKEYEIGD